jgi:hypothetical protein
MGGACNTHGKMKSAYRILVEELEGKRPLKRPRHRRKNNITVDLRETGWEDVDRIHLAVAASCEHGNEASGSTKGWDFFDRLSNLRFLKDFAPRSQLITYLG